MPEAVGRRGAMASHRRYTMANLDTRQLICQPGDNPNAKCDSSIITLGRKRVAETIVQGYHWGMEDRPC
jgi:hypothetical protein